MDKDKSNYTTKKSENKNKKGNIKINKNDNSKNRLVIKENSTDIKNNKNKGKSDNSMTNENKDNIKIDKNNLRIYSYNSRGFDVNKQKICTDLLEPKLHRNSILCNQENFVLKGNSYIIRKSLPNHHVFIKPAKKDKLEGRPVNGMFIALPKDLKNKAKDVTPTNNRVQAIKLDTDDGDILLINTYFPPDPKCKTYSFDTGMEEMLATIDNLIDSYQCSNVVMVGDFNTDYKRENGRVTRIDDFLSTHAFDLAWKIYEVDYTHEFEKDDISYTSTIDHIVWNRELSKNVTDAGVLHMVNNTSDHCPIYCDLKINMSTLVNNEKPNQPKKQKMTTKVLDENDWSQFNIDLEQKLALIEIPKCLGCQDVNCNAENHIMDIDNYVSKVVDSVYQSIFKQYL